MKEIEKVLHILKIALETKKLNWAVAILDHVFVLCKLEKNREDEIDELKDQIVKHTGENFNLVNENIELKYNLKAITGSLNQRYNITVSLGELNQKKIPLIKHLRAFFPVLSLREAKDLAEAMENQEEQRMLSALSPLHTIGFINGLFELFQGNKVSISIYQE